MTNVQTLGGVSPQESRSVTPSHPLPVRVFIVIGLICAGLIGYWIASNRAMMPSDDSAEAGFAHDMMMHHTQAVDMAWLILDRSDDETIRQLALDILMTQQSQIGEMRGWLRVWQVPVASTQPAMAWMGMAAAGLMPGMATPEQLDQLRGLTGTEAEVMFLNLMIPHHQAGVDMAKAVLQRSYRPEVTSLAQAIRNSQQSEIAYMTELLQSRGATQPEETNTIPEMPGMQHSE